MNFKCLWFFHSIMLPPKDKYQQSLQSTLTLDSWLQNRFSWSGIFQNYIFLFFLGLCSWQLFLYIELFQSVQFSGSQCMQDSLYIYIYFFFFFALGLRCCAWAFSSCGERGLLFVAVHRLLIGVASLVAEHRLQAPGLQQLWHMGSRVQDQQLWRTGLVAPQHVGSSRTRAQTRVPCIGRQIPNHCPTREALELLNKYFCVKHLKISKSPNKTQGTMLYPCLPRVLLLLDDIFLQVEGDRVLQGDFLYCLDHMSKKPVSS